jgi:hypothetical protein
MKHRLPEGGIAYRRDVFTESAEYYTLTVLELDSDSRSHAIKKIAKIYSGIAAKQFVADESKKAEEKNKSTNWQYSDVDLHGRIGVLKYKGVEIAQFFKRQLSKHRISHENPVSELRLKDPDDAWLRVDLTGLSTKQNKQSTINLIQQLQHQNETQERSLKVKQALIDELETRLRRYTKKKRKVKRK